jgi:hypothetical protein
MRNEYINMVTALSCEGRSSPAGGADVAPLLGGSGAAWGAPYPPWGTAGQVMAVPLTARVIARCPVSHPLTSRSSGKGSAIFLYKGQFLPPSCNWSASTGAHIFLEGDIVAPTFGE